MDEVILYKLGISADDFELIISTLRKSDFLTFVDQSLDPLDVKIYLEETYLRNVEFFVLIDLNLLINIVNLAKEESKRERHFREFAAAFVIFCQLADINIDPSIAIHESSQKVNEEISELRKIDNLKAEYLLKFLKKEYEFIPKRYLPKIRFPKVDKKLFSKNLKGHQVMKTSVTKLATIMRKDTLPLDKIREFMRWSHFEYIHVKEAFTLAMHQLGPYSEKSNKCILKSVQTDRFENLEKNIENAVNDLMLIRYWVKKDQADSKSLYLLASADETLIRLAKNLPIEKNGVQHTLKQSLMLTWDETDAELISKEYVYYLDLMAEGERKCHQSDFNPHSENYYNQIKDKLVSQFLS